MDQIGKTAQFWGNYMEMAAFTLKFLGATKKNDMDLHLAALQDMLPRFFAYDRHNYARNATVYLISILNLNSTHPAAEELLHQSGFSVSRSDIPSSRNAVDITIEQTISKHAKSHRGIVGFNRNYAAYFRWCVTRHGRASYVEGEFKMADMAVSENDSHKDNEKSHMVQSENDVKKLTDAFQNFTDLFLVEEKDVLYCHSSGVPASVQVENELLTCQALGISAFTTFLKKRLTGKTVSFYAPPKKLFLKTFASMKTSKKLISSDRKIVEIKAKNYIFDELMLLYEDSNISIERPLTYLLVLVPWALATAYGSPIKTDKEKLLHHLEGEISHSE